MAVGSRSSKDKYQHVLFLIPRRVFSLAERPDKPHVHTTHKIPQEVQTKTGRIPLLVAEEEEQWAHLCSRAFEGTAKLDSQGQ